MRAKRILVTLFAVACAAVAVPTAAHAVPYPAPAPPATVSTGTVAPGGAVTFSGTGFMPGERVRISVDGAGIRTVTASGSGSFSTSVRLSEPGNAVLVATGLTSGVTVTAAVRVLGGGGDDTAPVDGIALPTTGHSGKSLALATYGGVGAVVLGVGLIWLTIAWRRRVEPTQD